MTKELNVGDEVVINTDTVFDAEGVPVSIRNGSHARVWEQKDGWVQVIFWWDEEGNGAPEILGVRPEHLTFHSHIDGVTP